MDAGRQPYAQLHLRFDGPRAHDGRAVAGTVPKTIRTERGAYNAASQPTNFSGLGETRTYNILGQLTQITAGSSFSER